MTTDNLMTRRGLLAGAGATAVLAAGRAAAGETRPDDDLTRLSIAEASRRIATRELSPVELTRAYPGAHRECRPACQFLHHGNGRSGPRAGPRSQGRAHTRRAAQPAARYPDWPEGQHRYGRSPHHRRQRGIRGSHSGRGRRMRAQVARRRRDLPREAQHARVRVWRHVCGHELRARAKSVEPRVHPGRFLGWLCGSRFSQVVRRRPRHGYGGIDPPAGRILRGHRVQGDARTCEYPRHRAVVADARSRRPAGAQRR
jgi:hypothetical protein